ncbi:hypothetical protein VTK26DRAFT_3115 [Humicola hyalothermophila]
MSQKAPNKEQLNEIAAQAEQDLRSYQAKTGAKRETGLDDYGVNELVTKKFPGSDVKVGEDLVTSASYNRRIPGDEGGVVDDKGRFVRGAAYEGAGGPEEKTAHVYAHKLGQVEEATVRGWGQEPREIQRSRLREDRPDLLPSEQATGGRGREPAKRDEVSEQGRLAAKSNVGLSPASREEVPAQGSRGSSFKGAHYEAPESVPDQRADMGMVPPESTTETSKNI